MAVCAASLYEGGATIHRGGRVRSGHRRSQHAHEVGKCLNVGNSGGIDVGVARGRGRKIERVVGRGDVETAWGFIALLGEELVRDSHLDVVGFRGEHEQGLILGLPPKAGNGSIVGAEVGVAAQVGVGVPGDAQL